MIYQSIRIYPFLIIAFITLTLPITSRADTENDHEAYGSTFRSIATLKSAMQLYRLDHGRCTDNLEDLFFRGYIMRFATDGWGRKFNATFKDSILTIYSYGKDGKAGGERFDQDLIVTLGDCK